MANAWLSTMPAALTLTKIVRKNVKTSTVVQQKK